MRHSSCSRPRKTGPLDELQRARLERLRAQIALVRTSGTKRVPGLTIAPEAPGLLVDAAKRLEPLDAELARETYRGGADSGDVGP